MQEFLCGVVSRLDLETLMRIVSFVHARSALSVGSMLVLFLTACSATPSDPSDDQACQKPCGTSCCGDGESCVGNSCSSCAPNCAQIECEASCAGGSCVAGTCYKPAVINFDALKFDDDVSSQFSQYATFSTSGTFKVKVADYDWSYVSAKVASPPNWICTGQLVGGGCTADTYIDFAHPVRHLHFTGVAVDSAGKVATARVFAGSQMLGAVDVIGNGDDSKPPQVDLSAYENVTRLEIVNVTDSAGLGWDDFTFEAAQPK